MDNKLTSQDIKDFLLNAYFGDVCDPVYTAANSAYLDLNRTIEFKKAKNNISDEKKSELRQSCVEIIKSSVLDLSRINTLDKNKYDSWHMNLCESIMSQYCNDVHFYYGQAQKWINMTMKYLSVIDSSKTEPFFGFLHVPIDSIIIDIASEELKLSHPQSRWSRMSKNEYIDYQKQLCSKIEESTGLTPLLWEFRSWNR